MVQLIFLGADHRGFALKESLKQWLREQALEVVDCGNTVRDSSDDFPVFSQRVAQSVRKNPGSRGIVLCGSAAGVTIMANKVPGIRAAQADNSEQVKEARDHLDIQVLAIAADRINEEDAKNIVQAFLQTPFSAEDRFIRRIREIEAYEQRED